MISFGANRIQVNIFGGLGNQFFCYFAGKFLSQESGLGLTINVSRVNKSQFKFGSSLEDFKLSELIDRTTQVAPVGLSHKVAKRIAHATNHISNFPRTFEGEFLSKGTGFEPSLRHVRKSVILNSYFQSYKYIDALPIGSQIMPDIDGDRSAAYNFLLDKVKLQSPVIIHFRRGDYLKHAETFGNLGKNYYEGALSMLPSHLLAKGCWIFSDDLNAAKSSLGKILPSSTYWVDPSCELSAAETLKLMTHGSAYIIANSTFSYWGAKFNLYQPFVVAPTNWFKSLQDPHELTPPYWHLSQSFWD